MKSYEINREVLEIVDELEPLLGGTLCLLTMTALHGPRLDTPYFTDKILKNLTSLSEHPNLSPEFKLVCARLASRWQFHVNHSTDNRTINERPCQCRHPVCGRKRELH